MDQESPRLQRDKGYSYAGNSKGLSKLDETVVEDVKTIEGENSTDWPLEPTKGSRIYQFRLTREMAYYGLPSTISITVTRLNQTYNFVYNNLSSENKTIWQIYSQLVGLSSLMPEIHTPCKAYGGIGYFIDIRYCSDTIPRRLIYLNTNDQVDCCNLKHEHEENCGNDSFEQATLDIIYDLIMRQ